MVKRFVSEPYPPLLLIDNLHFMDRHSRDFFRFFLKNADTKPFFVLTDRHPDPGVQEVFGGLETVALSPLSRDEALLKVINDLPGLLQTELYELFPGEERKRLQGLLLRLDQQGAVRREKKKGSYRVFPA